MIRPFAPFTARPRAVASVKVSHGLPPSDVEVTHEEVTGKSPRGLLRLAGTKCTPTLKVLGRKSQTMVIGKRT